MLHDLDVQSPAPVEPLRETAAIAAELRQRIQAQQAHPLLS
jgi:hypothetical protein